MKHLSIVFCTLFFSAHITFTKHQNVIFCTYFTDSHARLANEFMLPSLQDNVDVIKGTGEQLCPTATFFQSGWTQTTLNKVKFIIDVTTQHKGDIIVFVDPDIIFFKPVKERLLELLIDKDFVGQLDNPEKTICTGFFAMRANDAVIDFWKLVQRAMERNPKLCDQKAFNYILLKNKNPTNMRWDFLPSNEFFGGGTFKKKTWKPRRNFHIPQDPFMFHANFTLYKFKIPMLNHVKKILTQRAQLLR